MIFVTSHITVSCTKQLCNIEFLHLKKSVCHPFSPGRIVHEFSEDCRNHLPAYAITVAQPAIFFAPFRHMNFCPDDSKITTVWFSDVIEEFSNTEQ